MIPSPALTRRALAALLLIPAVPALAQAPAEKKAAPAIDLADLMKPGPIRENVLGSDTAPVTIIEYASLTCPHCAHFHEDTFPVLRANYIDTGKVRFIFRDFPFDGLALAATMLSRCAKPVEANPTEAQRSARFFEVTATLMKQQEAWAFGKDPEAALRKLFTGFGFTPESFDACLNAKDIYDGVLAGRTRAYETFGVDSTPTLFINGAKHSGALTVAQIEAILRPLLAGKP